MTTQLTANSLSTWSGALILLGMFLLRLTFHGISWLFIAQLETRSFCKHLQLLCRSLASPLLQIIFELPRFQPHQPQQAHISQTPPPKKLGSTGVRDPKGSARKKYITFVPRLPSPCYHQKLGTSRNVSVWARSSRTMI